MTPEEGLKAIDAELTEAIDLPKCRKCGCMEGALKNLAVVLPTVGTDKAAALDRSISASLKKMRPIQYDCLGCEHCYPAVAQNAFDLAFPSLGKAVADLACEFRVGEEGWPPVAGEYTVLDEAGPVAVTTLASVQLAEELARRQPNGLAIVGKTETENIGIDKIIKNIITSPGIRSLIVAGRDAKGHLAGETLLALAEHGVDQEGRVIGSDGRRPVLRNVTALEIESFLGRVQVIDMLGCEEREDIISRITELSVQESLTCSCGGSDTASPVAILTAPRITAVEGKRVIKMDQAGYFVIIPSKVKGVIDVEHYAYDNTLLRVIEGANARAIYHTLIDNGWVTQLSHAAYLGKELVQAEMSLQGEFKYVQDGA